MIPVGILGACGLVGRRYAELLADHPWFEVVFLGGSERTAGHPYEHEVFADRRVEPVDAAHDCELLFSCIGDREVARRLEVHYADTGIAVVSNSSAHRSHPLVPIIIPEINAHHLDVISQQPWKAPLIAKCNCSLQAYLLPLAALHKSHRIERVMVTTLQAISGAGRDSLSALEIIDNVIPHIPGEEEKSESEPLKILGRVTSSGIEPATDVTISAHCNRVPVVDGHMACVSVEFAHQPSREEILQAWDTLPGLDLPSAPTKPIDFLEGEDRPQPRFDRNLAGGMGVAVGRLRECPVLDWRFVGLSHNAVRGAAGGGILNAELLVKSRHWHATQSPLSTTPGPLPLCSH